MTYAVTPRSTVRENEKDYTLELVMPGVTKDNLVVEINDNRLTFDAKTSLDVGDRERITRALIPEEYHHEIALGEDIDREKISASVANGVVTVTLAKKEKPKPYKITVQ